jgi:xanthosine utilization system XapX-like protein
MSKFERLGIVIGVITALVFTFCGLISAGNSYGPVGKELLGYFGGMILVLTLEAAIFLMPRTFYWVRGDMRFFSSFSPKRSIAMPLTKVLSFFPKNSEFKEILKGAAFVFLCSLGGNFIVGFIYGMLTQETTVPPALQGLANVVSISFGFYLLARKQITRTWSRLVAIAFVSWTFGIINIFISDEVTVATFFYGLPLVLLIMGLTCWIVFVCRKTPS